MSENREVKNLQHGEVFDIVTRLLNSIRYGSITLVIQDGRIIQVDSQEKIRLK
jgi:hypothetical protein